MKRMISMLLALVLVLTLLPVAPAAAKTGGKLVAITFDDGPHKTYTKQLLDGLKKRGVPATFFVLGENASRYPSLVTRAYEEGHEIASHTWDHANLKNLTTAEIKEQVNKTVAQLEKATGKGADIMLRPPYGSYDQKVLDLLDCPVMFWSVDSEDWSLKDEAKVRKKIVAEAYDGSIILCHDIHKTTIPAVLGAIDDLMELGYEFVTVSELFRRRGRELKDHVVYYNSNKNGTDLGPIPAPQITCTPEGNQYRVTLTCTDSKVPIYYTLDGSYPNQEATRYTGPFTMAQNAPLKVVAAYQLNGSRSVLVSMNSSDVKVNAPSITLDSKKNVVMKTSTPGAAIYYTLDGTVPTAASTLYTGPGPIEGGGQLQAVAILGGAVSRPAKAYLSSHGDLYYDIAKGQWFYDAMDWCHRMGILNGTAAYTMSPDMKLTRGMLVTLLYRFSGEKLESGWKRTNKFADVNQSLYYAESIEWAFRNRIVSGHSATRFAPEETITRQQMCKMVYGFLNYMETPLERGESCKDDFRDYHLVESWAVESVNAMVSAGLIQGSNGRLTPNDGASRAQFCVLILRIRDYIDNYGVTEEPEPSQPSEPEPTDPTQPSEPEPTDPTQPTEPEPTDPTQPTEPSEPDHDCYWILNKTDVSIDVGESFRLYLVCGHPGCNEQPEYTWSAQTEGVVSIEGEIITGLQAGAKTNVFTDCDGTTYTCIVRIRKAANPAEILTMA